MAQTFGWNWGENLKPRKAARFSMAYTVFIALAALIVLTGLNPMKLTLFSMAITALILPLTAMPFLILMNDPTYMGAHVNSRFSNIAVVLIVIVAAVLAVVSIPLEIMGSR
jgi:Mn2+/Fe2+ NRAMP family transporter